MRQLIGWMTALSLPVLLLVGSAAAQKADKDPDKEKKDPDKEKLSDKWVKAGTIQGKVTAVYEDKRKLRVQVTYTFPKLNVSAVQNLQNAQRDFANARAQGNAQGMLNAQNAMRQAQAQMYTVEKQTKDVEVQAIEEVVVRAARPKEEFDDKGKIKKLTKAELKEQKGPDPKMPGYHAEFSDLSTEQYVALTIVRKKGAPKPKPKIIRPKKGKLEDEEVADLLEDTTPQVSMIIFSVPLMPKGK